MNRRRIISSLIVCAGSLLTLAISSHACHAQWAKDGVDFLYMSENQVEENNGTRSTSWSAFAVHTQVIATITNSTHPSYPIARVTPVYRQKFAYTGATPTSPFSVSTTGQVNGIITWSFDAPPAPQPIKSIYAEGGTPVSGASGRADTTTTTTSPGTYDSGVVSGSSSVTANPAPDGNTAYLTISISSNTYASLSGTSGPPGGYTLNGTARAENWTTFTVGNP